MSDLQLDLTRIRPNWWVVLPICALLLFGAILFGIVLTLPAVRASTAQASLPGELSWPIIIVADVVTVGGTLWLWWGDCQTSPDAFHARRHNPAATLGNGSHPVV